MSAIGFAGKLLYGGIDVGALLPLDPDCNADVEAASAEQALGHCGSTHDGTIDNPSNRCGDNLREVAVTTLQLANGANAPAPDSKGYPDFDSWPKWSDITHQIMWVDWIKRAYLGGLRVMVALAVNNKTLADLVKGTGATDPRHPDDDKASADQQILELKSFVGRNSDWMGIAYTAEDVKTLLRQNKLAIVLGLEVDNIGDFNVVSDLTESEVHAEIVRLYGEGVRYMFPVHVLDNKFGTAAYYNDLFNLSNELEAGHFMNLECSQVTDDIDQVPMWCQALSSLPDPFQNLPAQAEMAAVTVVGLGLANDAISPVCPQCGVAPSGRKIGLVNRGVPYPGLTPLGKFAILDMMRQGMLIDVDHMSDASTTDTLALALQEQYPVNSGHNTVRENGGSERNLSRDAYAKIGMVHGMAGVGIANETEVSWIGRYQTVLGALGRSDAAAAFGTDANGISPMMKAPPATLPLLVYDDAGYPPSGLGNTCWNYNETGVAHYGLLSDLVRALPQADGGALVQSNLMKGAQYFYDTWRIAETYAAAHAGEAGVPIAAAARIVPTCTGATVYVAECNRCLPPSTECAQAPPVCEPPRVPDAWGLCAPAEAQQPYVAMEPPPEATAAATILESGTYTLRLQARVDGPGSPGQHGQDFVVPVTGVGRSVTLGAPPRTGAGGAAAGSGGFRGNRFFARVRAGAQWLTLVAIVPDTGKLDELHGAFVAYAPGTPPIRGGFRLRRTAETTDATRADEPFANLPSFLERLRP